MSPGIGRRAGHEYFIAIFVVFSYIKPVPRTLAAMDAAEFSLTLALFGLAGVVGTVVGGLANDCFGAERTLRVQFAWLGSQSDRRTSGGEIRVGRPL
jgi:predicted MFS family arabinose efflux permease